MVNILAREWCIYLPERHFVEPLFDLVDSFQTDCGSRLARFSPFFPPSSQEAILMM